MKKLLLGFVLGFAFSMAVAASASTWSPWFTRSEIVQPNHRVHTAVVPVKINGDIYACVISEDSSGQRGSASMGLAQSCDFSTPAGP